MRRLRHNISSAFIVNCCEMFCCRIADRLPQMCPDRLRCQPADNEFESEKHAIYRYFISYSCKSSTEFILLVVIRHLDKQ